MLVSLYKPLTALPLSTALCNGKFPPMPRIHLEESAMVPKASKSMSILQIQEHIKRSSCDGYAAVQTR